MSDLKLVPDDLDRQPEIDHLKRTLAVTQQQLANANAQIAELQAVLVAQTPASS
jgi:hypothetical protein